MSTITIHNWKEVSNDGDNFVFVDPEYHPTYWEVPKWWYKGDRTVYTSCVRVDLNDTTSIYIDGTTPLMQLTIDYDGDKLRGSDWRDIRRVLVCAKGDLGAINRGESDAYDDVEFFKNYYITRVNNYAPEVIDPLIPVLKPEFYSELPVAAGSSAPFDTGTWHGGVEPVTYEWRYQAQNYESDVWYPVGDWKAQPNEAIQETLTLPDDSDAWYIYIESRAVDAEGTTVYNNSEPRRALHRVKKEPGTIVKYADFNTYEEGSEVVFETATFYGGVPPVQYRHRIQQRNTTGDGWTNGSWTQYDNTVQTRRETITFPEGAEMRIQCQAVDSAKDGSTSAQANGDIKTVVAVPTTYWGNITVKIDNENYDFYEAAPYEIYEDDSVIINVTWDGTATGNCLWSKRSQDSAVFSDTASTSTTVTIPESGTNILSFTLTDPSGLAEPTSIAYPVQIVALEKPSLLPVVTKVNGEIYDPQATGAFSAPGGSEIVLTVETNPDAAAITKAYHWSERQGAGEFISSDRARSVAFVLGEAGSYSVCVCAITAADSAEGQVNSAFIQILAT